MVNRRKDRATRRLVAFRKRNPLGAYHRTYSANLRIRRANNANGLLSDKGNPIVGERTAATIARKARSQGKRRERREAAARAKEATSAS